MSRGQLKNSAESMRTGIKAPLVALVLAGSLALVAGCSSSGSTSSTTAPPTTASAATITSASQGDQSAIQTEVNCINAYAPVEANNFLNYAVAIGAPEVTDSAHSGTQPCATFSGSMTGNNQVAQYLSKQIYPGLLQMVVFGGPKAAFAVGGAPGTAIASYTKGPYVVRFNPADGKQIWKTFLPTLSGQWIAAPSVAVLKGGWVDVATGPTVYKLNPSTGAIVAQVQQPILAGQPVDANFDGFQVSPDSQGTILLKSQMRPTGCTTQGNQAMQSCQAQYGAQPNTTVVAVNPNTLKNEAALQLNQPIIARPTVVPHGNETYIYLAGNTKGVRVIWNPQKKTLTQDMTWNPTYVLPGEGPGDAPVPLGNWVLYNTNAGSGATTPECVTAVAQSNASDIHTICPWGMTLPAGVSSNATASLSVDTQNNMIFIQNLLERRVFAVRLNQSTGAMTAVWSRPDWTTSDYFASVGPKNNRVVVSQYMNPTFNGSQIQTGSYTESVIWVSENTGKTLAMSAYNGPTEIAWFPMPGYAGRYYTLSNKGTLNIYAVSSCKSTSTAALQPPSTTTCATGTNGIPAPIENPKLPAQPTASG